MFYCFCKMATRGPLLEGLFNMNFCIGGKKRGFLVKGKAAGMDQTALLRLEYVEVCIRKYQCR